MSAAPVLDVQDLRVHFPVREGLIRERVTGTIKAVDGVSLRLDRAETLGLVGESGCGKSTCARAVLRLVPLTSGTVRFQGQDLAGLTPRALRALRPRMQLVFQDPYASLNPRMTVFDAIAEPLRVHKAMRKTALTERVAELMDQVGLARRFVRKYPHEFSGGQRQRIAIARALALDPELIIADEPVSALDVSVQAQILNLIAGLCRERQLALVLISHDLGVVHYLSQRIAVMYLGKIVEMGPADEVFGRPRHPYAQALLSAIPVPDPECARGRIVLRGAPPSPMNPPDGCPFHPRCPHAIDACRVTAPALELCGPGHFAACLRINDLPASPGEV